MLVANNKFVLFDQSTQEVMQKGAFSQKPVLSLLIRIPVGRWSIQQWKPDPHVPSSMGTVRPKEGSISTTE